MDDAPDLDGGDGVEDDDDAVAVCTEEDIAYELQPDCCEASFGR